MLVLKLELHSAVTGQVTELGRMIIANDGEGTRDVGNYDVKLGRKGQTDNSKVYWKPSRKGKVMGHKRMSENVWSLVGKALRAVRF